MAHKINHSFSPNCTWDNAEHPVYGLVPAVRYSSHDCVRFFTLYLHLRENLRLVLNRDVMLYCPVQWYMNGFISLDR